MVDNSGGRCNTLADGNICDGGRCKSDCVAAAAAAAAAADAVAAAAAVADAAATETPFVRLGVVDVLSGFSFF